MDKQIVDKLIKFGLITNIGVDAAQYKDVDDLIAKGIITIPGAKERINVILGDAVELADESTVIDMTITNPDEDDNNDNIVVIQDVAGNDVITEVLNDNSPVIDETPESEPVIDETPVTDEPIVDTPEDVTPIDEAPVTEQDIIVEEAPKKTKKSKKTE